MGRVLALPCDQQASEHTHRPTVADLAELPINAQFLQHTFSADMAGVCLVVDSAVLVKLRQRQTSVDAKLLQQTHTHLVLADLCGLPGC